MYAVCTPTMLVPLLMSRGVDVHMMIPGGGRFVAVTHGEDERVMPGHALAMQTDKPFRSLQQVKGGGGGWRGGKRTERRGREGQDRAGQGGAPCLVLSVSHTLFHQLPFWNLLGVPVEVRLSHVGLRRIACWRG